MGVVNRGLKLSDLPNLITIFRVLLIYPVVYLVLQQEHQLALALFFIAGASDVIDGFLARRFGWTSRLGSWLDPVADKTMQISVYFVMAWVELIPWWLVVAVILRDAVIVAGGIAYYFLIEKGSAEPCLLSKINTGLQILVILAVLFHHGVMAIPELWISMLFYTVLATIILSGGNYVWIWSRRAIAARQRTRGMR
jgi:cardiolipin synthase